MKFLMMITLCFSFSAMAQTSFKKITKDNLVSFDIGATPTTCVSKNDDEIATQTISVKLKDGSLVVFEIEGIDRGNYEDGYREYSSCFDALNYLKASVQHQSLTFFSIQSGDVSSQISNGAVLCTLLQYNVMLEGNTVKSFDSVNVPVKCP